MPKARAALFVKGRSQLLDTCMNLENNRDKHHTNFNHGSLSHSYSVRKYDYINSRVFH